MNSNINLDINSYLSEELEKLVGLKESYDRNNLFDKIKVIKEDINNSNLSETKRNDFNIFLDNIYAKLTNKLLNNSNGNKISQFDSEHFVIKRPENKKIIDESTTLESNKKIGKSIIKNWSSSLEKFIKVVPNDFKKVLKDQQNNKRKKVLKKVSGF